MFRVLTRNKKRIGAGDPALLVVGEYRSRRSRSSRKLRRADRRAIVPTLDVLRTVWIGLLNVDPKLVRRLKLRATVDAQPGSASQIDNQQADLSILI